VCGSDLPANWNFGEGSGTVLEAWKRLLIRLAQWPGVSPLEVRVFADGFGVLQGEALLFGVRWADVEEVVAFRERTLSADRLGLAFRLCGEAAYHRADDTMAGYAALVDEVERVYPDYNRGWRSEMAYPVAFRLHRTIVWARPRQ
jgi:hypothetical protein